jgi:hypothetical protein
MKQEVIPDKMTIVTGPGDQWVLPPLTTLLITLRFPKPPKARFAVLIQGMFLLSLAGP